MSQRPEDLNHEGAAGSSSGTHASKLVEIRGLKKHFPIGGGWFSRPKGWVRAVDGIDLDIYEGETLGLVGESGCGKTTTGRLVLRLIEPTEGSVRFGDVDIYSLPPNEMRRMRREMQIIFQDPFGSLNPRQTVGEIIGEGLKVHGLARGRKLQESVAELLEVVGLSPDHARRYPHEFSGGQRQRIGIARALALRPKFVVCDEPVSALDVSIQSQVINLLEDLQEQFKLTYLFIAHDLSVVRHISDRVGVMYVGKLVELADADELFRRPLHPYTQALLSAVPLPDPQRQRRRERIVLQGDVPSPANPPKGCRFHPRCPFAEAICREQEPEFRALENGHYVACHLAERLPPAAGWEEVAAAAGA